MKFYNWKQALSYSTADVIMVVGARSIGKTYGLRKRCILDFIQKGKRFVEVVRHKNELDGDDSIIEGYFDKLEQNNEFPEYVFKTKKHAGYIARKPAGEKKPEWELLCYFCALTDQQNLKKKTFANVGKIIFDEAVLDTHDRYHNYLPREYDKIANLISTITRQLADGSSDKVQLFLLGNSCDLLNPYFIANKIDKEPSLGFSWHNSKTFLLHYVDATEYGEGMLDNTIAGRMVRGREEAATMAGNQFENAHIDFVEKKTRNSEFVFGVHFEQEDLGIWIDWDDGLYYVNRKIPNNARPVFTLTAKDNRLIYTAAERCNPYLQSLSSAFYSGALRYDSAGTRETFTRILKLLGVR